MFCKYCGKKVNDDARFCDGCGTKLISEVPAGTEGKLEQVPKDVFYTSSGKLGWFFRDYERDPSGNYIIRHEFDKESITQYYGIDLGADPKKDHTFKDTLNNLADVGMTLAILTGDSDMHWDAAELYDRTESMGSVNCHYYYKKVTTVEKDPETGWIHFKHGIDKPFLWVNPEQLTFILGEFMKRCPKAVLGEVRKRK